MPLFCNLEFTDILASIFRAYASCIYPVIFYIDNTLIIHFHPDSSQMIISCFPSS